MDFELHTRLGGILQQISESCSRARRAASEITVVAITKTHPGSSISNAYALGVRHFGENRAQELIEKYSDICSSPNYLDIAVHFVGHLQSNKVRKVIPIIWSVDSVDSVSLAEGISLVSGELGKTTRVLLEVNTSGEPQKFGVSPDELLPLAERILPLPHLRLAGLMTVGPNVDDESSIRRSFVALRESFERIRQKLNPPYWSTLSMGMSGDYPIAIEEGATEIRLGTALFGARS
ncbi:MAG: YggS family pyridoxal phosphate-dependent enzyme [bacterium]|nr:YggS family pyridoxal phosphate-dependent enzyme [bacterium]